MALHQPVIVPCEDRPTVTVVESQRGGCDIRAEEVMRRAVPYLVCVLASSVGASGLQKPESALPGAEYQAPHVDRFLAATDRPLVSYRAVRRLEAQARNGRMKATLTAMTSIDSDGRFQFSVLDETGSKMVCSRVLRAALEAERGARNSGDFSRGALTRLNYDFGPTEVDEDGLVRVSIHPRRTDDMLVEGSILLTDQADLVRIEGRLVKRPSFWTRRVEVIRRYTRLAGVRVPISMESTAEVRLAGRSTFAMQYEYEVINGERPGTAESLRDDQPGATVPSR
jgi:hypothetical protein